MLNGIRLIQSGIAGPQLSDTLVQQVQLCNLPAEPMNLGCSLVESCDIFLTRKESIDKINKKLYSQLVLSRTELFITATEKANHCAYCNQTTLVADCCKHDSIMTERNSTKFNIQITL